MSSTNTLFIGITSWNSELFLECCLSAIAKTTSAINTRVVVLDNCSDDGSAEIARSYQVEFICEAMSQPDALNKLLSISEAEYTLLIHADTILLSDRWFDVCVKHVTEKTILVSPEDIGCGPMTRDFGRGHPESSFLFLNTVEAKKIRHWRVKKQRYKIPTRFELCLDFFGPHITHNLVDVITRNDKQCKLMSVLPSRSLSQPIYRPDHISNHWSDDIGHLEYGLGNFYALDDTVTHYHNWFDRIGVHGGMKNALTTGKNNQGFPVQFVHEYTSSFINDFWNNSINIPEVG